MMKGLITTFLITGSVLLPVNCVRPPSAQHPLQTTSPTSAVSDHGPKVQFESGEHDFIGDALKLHYPGGFINGSNFRYNISQKHGDSNSLSFGQLVAFGDYYGTYQINSDFIPEENAFQISDYWRSNRTEALVVFDKIINLVRTNYKCDLCDHGYLPDLSNDFAEEKKAAIQYHEEGGDAAQFYEDKFASWYAAYSYDTTNAVTIIAWLNWDHFGQDAIFAYMAGHALALRYAKLAHSMQNMTLLTEAYFAEGYAQHFLSDLFSTGHHRAPRRVLHGGIINTEAAGLPTSTVNPAAPLITARGDFPPDGPTTEHSTLTSTGKLGLPTIGARDRLSNYMHNEDCANGLLVANALGEQWPAYGDNQLFSEKSIHNLAQSQKAGQAGVDEVYRVFQTGMIPEPAEFAALKVVPLLLNDSPISNYQPLFYYDPALSKYVYKRAHVDQRNSSDVSKLDPETAPYEAWDNWYTETADSGENTNMYPYTKAGLATNSSLIQFREANNSIVITAFGNITFGNITTWDANRQVMVSLKNFKTANDTWQWVSSIQSPSTKDVYWLTATSVSEKMTFNIHRLTVTIPTTNISMSSIISYRNATYADDTQCGLSNAARAALAGTINTQEVPFGEVLLLNGKSDLAHDDLSAATLIMSSWPTHIHDPSVDDRIAKIANAYGMTSIQFGVHNTSTITLIASQTVGNATGISTPNWYFAYWSANSPARPIIVNVPENSTIGRVPRVLATHLLTFQNNPSSAPSGEYALRIGHATSGSGSGRADLLVIDILSPILTSTDEIAMELIWQSPYTLPSDSTIDFATDKASWFVSGSMAHGVKLVGYIHSLASNTGLITILSFEYQHSKSQFELVASSTITNDTDISPPRKLVTAGFMRPVNAAQVDAGEWPSIMATFDNYGVLGARLVGPVVGGKDGAYELKGQTPALAGQMSTGLGWSDFGVGFGEGVGYVWDTV